jgi:hypothetical protein
MTSNGWNAWRPQTPPSDFAVRAAGAVVRDHHERRRRTMRRRWVTATMLAAAMLGGTALALTGHLRTKPDVPVYQGKGGVMPTFHAKGMPVSKASAREIVQPEPIAPEPAPPVSVPQVRSKKREAPPASSAPADAGRPLIVPPCNCQQGSVLCDCIEMNR